MWLRPSYSSFDDMCALARRLEDDGVPLLNVHLPLERDHRRRQPLQPDRRRNSRRSSIASIGSSRTPSARWAPCRSRSASSARCTAARSAPRPGSTGTVPGARRAMHICHVTAAPAPRPGRQRLAAAAPRALGARGGRRRSVTSRTRRGHRSAAAPTPLRAWPQACPGAVTWVPARAAAPASARVLRLSSLVARRGASAAPPDPFSQRADVVHVHSNGLLPEVAALPGRELRASRSSSRSTAPRSGTTRRRCVSADLFTRDVPRGQSRHVLLAGPARSRAGTRPRSRAASRRLSAGRGRTSVRATRPRSGPTPGANSGLTRASRAAEREAAAPAGRPAVPDRRHARRPARLIPTRELVFCGTGPLAGELRARRRDLGVADHVTFAGLVDNQRVALYYAAADVFVLPSLLEACPTVAVEALACGTPVISADNPGGVELGRLFGDDVAVVPRETPGGARGRHRHVPAATPAHARVDGGGTGP